MAGGVAHHRPHSVRIHGEAEVLAELARRGPRKAFAQDSGISESSISNMATGARPVSITLAAQLGFVLAWVRSEELALADRIEAEMYGVQE